MADAAVAQPGPPSPRGHWPPAPLALPCHVAIGRSVRRSPASPRRGAFPDWVPRPCFVNDWLPLLSIKAPRTETAFLHSFSSGLAAWVGLTEAAVSERLAPPRRPPPAATASPSRRVLPAGHWLPAPPVARPLLPRPLPLEMGVTRAAGASYRLVLSPANPTGTVGSRGASARGRRSARRLATSRAGRGKVRGPPGGGGQCPYVRAMTSPIANQEARGRPAGCSGAEARARPLEPLCRARLAARGGGEVLGCYHVCHRS